MTICLVDLTNPQSIWHVTTEGDCEGRSRHSLGYYKGTLANVAFAIADKAMYDLQFELINDLIVNVDVLTPVKSSVTLSVRGSGFSSYLDPSDIEYFYTNNNYGFNVAKGGAYEGVTMTLNKAILVSDMKKRAALAKLSVEDKKALGLED